MRNGNAGNEETGSLWQFVRLRLQTIIEGFNVEAAALVRFGRDDEDPEILGAAGQADDVTVVELARSGARTLHGTTNHGEHAWGTTWVDGRTLYSGLAEPALGGLLVAFALMPEESQPLAMPQALVLLLSYLVSEVGSSAPLDLSLMDGMPWAAALVDASALILFMNDRARWVAERHPQVDLGQGRLQLRRSALNRTLHRLVEQVARGERPRAIVPVLDRSGMTTLALHLEALPRSSRLVAGYPRAIAYLIELHATGAPDRRALANLFSLSVKEARLAELLCQGLRLDAASQAMGISRNTAKIHLRHILEKTGTSSQVDLARVLSLLPNRDGPSEPTINRVETVCPTSPIDTSALELSRDN